MRFNVPDSDDEGYDSVASSLASGDEMDTSTKEWVKGLWVATDGIQRRERTALDAGPEHQDTSPEL